MKPYVFSFPIILHFDCSVNVALFVQTYDFIYKTPLLGAILSNNLILCNNFVKNSRLKFCETVCCQKLARQFRVNDSHNSYHKRGIQGNPSIEKITKLINIKPQFPFRSFSTAQVVHPTVKVMFTFKSLSAFQTMIHIIYLNS